MHTEYMPTCNFVTFVTKCKCALIKPGNRTHNPHRRIDTNGSTKINHSSKPVELKRHNKRSKKNQESLQLITRPSNKNISLPYLQ